MAGIHIGKTAMSGGRPNSQSPRAMHLDILIGFLGFFAFVCFCMTAYAELTGDDAVLEALILLGLVVVLFGLFKVRRRIN